MLSKSKYIKYFREIKKILIYLEAPIISHFKDYGYYEDEIRNDDYNFEDKKAIFLSNFNITERKLLSIFIKVYNFINRYEINFIPITFKHIINYNTLSLYDIITDYSNFFGRVDNVFSYNSGKVKIDFIERLYEDDVCKL